MSRISRDHRTTVDLVALAALPYLSVEGDGINPVALYEKFLGTEYPDLPDEDIHSWVAERLAELAVPPTDAG